MIAVDNAVELMMSTYISLPKRVTGIEATRKEKEQYLKNFPSLLDGIEAYAADKIIGLDLGEIEWLHRLRNQLYHNGNGLSVEKIKVEFYAEIASKLFASLFSSKLDLPETESMGTLERFLSLWIALEIAFRGHDNKRYVNPLLGAQEKLSQGRFTKTDYRRFKELRDLRNVIVHSTGKPQDSISSGDITDLANLLEKAK